MTSNNYYIDEYTRLVNSISLNDEYLDDMVNKITEKTEKVRNYSKKQLAFVAAAVAVTVLGVKLFTDSNKKI